MTTPSLSGQLWDVVVGDVLGRGQDRVVYTVRGNESWVIKVEEMAGTYQNISEWETWKTVKDTPAAKWFAKPIHLSPNGALLVMERTIPLRSSEHPKRLPKFLCDFKPENFGWLRGKIVCHDYGTFHIHAGTELLKASKSAMTKVNWR